MLFNKLTLVMNSISDSFGKLDLLILNAGISMADPVSSFSNVEPFKRVMDVNYISSVDLTLKSLSLLKNGDGRIAIVSSLLGLFSGPCRSGYAASKMALKGFFDCLRIEEPKISVTM
jgi:dehydrogenase/reductase SDR family member 7B